MQRDVISRLISGVAFPFRLLQSDPTRFGFEVGIAFGGQVFQLWTDQVNVVTGGLPIPVSPPFLSLTTETHGKLAWAEWWMNANPIPFNWAVFVNEFYLISDWSPNDHANVKSVSLHDHGRRSRDVSPEPPSRRLDRTRIARGSLYDFLRQSRRFR